MAPKPAAAADAPRVRAGAWAELHRRAASRAAPPSILVDAGNDILHIDGDAGRYLRHAGGEPTRDVVALVTPELRLALRAALFQARQGSHPAVTAPARIGGGGGGGSAARALAIAVRALDAADAGGTPGLLLLQFFETEAPAAPDGAHEPQPDGGHAAMLQLEDELRFARRKLQETMDHADAAVHDERLANEWLRSTVAELQSSLEDQQRRHEELQSLNEEQVTVNAQLRSKVEDTAKAHDDLSNLIASTDIATIFLDREMRILRYTPRIGEIFNVIPGDVGRPLAHLASRLEYPRLVADIAGVLESAQPVEREVDGKEGRCYIVRIHPYRTTDDRINGAVMTCFDITGRRAAEQALRRSEERHRAELEQLVRERTAELERSRDLLRATMDASIDMIQVFEAVRDADGRIVDFHWTLNNHTSESRYGEVRGESLLERNPGVIEEGIFAAFCQVTETGEPLQAERHYAHEQFDSWFLQSVVKLGDGVATTSKDIGDWKRAQAELLRLRDEMVQARLQESERALRSSEARHAFLLTLSDALRPLDEPEDIVYTAARVLGERLGSDRAYYVHVDEERQEFVVEHDWYAPGESSHAGRFPCAAWNMPWLADGRTWVVADVDTDAVLPDPQRPAYRAKGIRAAIVVPLIKHGRLVATFCTNQRQPRAWTPTEVGLIEDTAERLWATIERAGAKAALRDTSERLSLLLQSMDEGVIGIAPDHRCMFINDAAAAMLGCRADELVGRCAQALLGDGRVLKAMQEGVSMHVEGEAFRCEDGTPLRISCQVSPMVLGGNPAGAVVVFRRA
ncbi:PAS domain-containing protein [Herbaspirillum sp. SJZ107]|uniref:PAS domain-containing protein n=1 Tax=Herbaspirillum sp. SJZ107 TaxID=2572881 RepID=UPI0011523C0A|nr:PAS domain-containing protein [Herbaspirillum sp. SJZ107]